MWVSAQMLSAEIGCTTRTILCHVRQMEQDGFQVKSRVGRPIRINRERFLMRMFPGWKEGDKLCGQKELSE